MKIGKNIHILLSLLLLLLGLFMKGHLSFAADTISANHSLSGEQTIVSEGGNFALGFFKSGRLSNYYVGIWYKKVSEQTVVWVANRETPVSDIYTSHITIQNGNFVLLNESQSLIWSTNVSCTSSSSVMAILLDDGNLKLIDGLSNINTTTPIWQSFDNPSNTWLPGGKLSYDKITKTIQPLTSWKNSEDPAPGYEPNSDEDWSRNDFSRDCVRETRLQCENNSTSQRQRDRFWMLDQMRLHEDSESLAVGSATECESLCLGNYPCTAYAYENNLCSMWDGELLNLQKLSDGDGNGRTLHLRLAASDFSSQENNKETAEEGIAVSSSKPKSKMIISITVIVAFLLASSLSYILFRRRIIANRQGSKDDSEMQTQNLVENNEVIDVPFLNFVIIQTATDNFSDANKLGQGGFGPVYKAVFPGGKEFAVKRLSSHSGQGIQEFQNEVSLIAKLQH